MFTNKKVLIFDLDGTLIDSIGIWNAVDSNLFKKLEVEGNKDEASIQFQRDAFMKQNTYKKNPYFGYCEHLKNIYELKQSAEEIYTMRYDIAQDYLKNVIAYKKDADIFIKKCKNDGYTLLMATTSKRSCIDIYRTENKNITEKANFDTYFSHIYTCEDVKNIKPHPEIYLRILQDFSVTAEECLIFEDSAIGMEAATRASIECVAVYDKYSEGNREKITELSTYQIQSYAELLR